MSIRREDLLNIIEIQCTDGNWNYDEYMHGLANGLITAYNVAFNSSPAIELLNSPKEFIYQKALNIVDEELGPELGNLDFTGIDFSSGIRVHFDEEILKRTEELAKMELENEKLQPVLPSFCRECSLFCDSDPEHCFIFRLFQEKEDLTAKMLKLAAFELTDTADKLSDEMNYLLNDQYDAMLNYHRALRKRIALLQTEV